MKYKVGDKVKIRSWDSMKAEYGLDENGNIKISNVVFIRLMERWCEKVVTIKKVFPNHYWIKENEWAWTDEMIDHHTTKIMSIIYRLEMLKNLVNGTSKIIIDENIKILKSNKPKFSDYYVNYYNDIFRKIKTGKI